MVIEDCPEFPELWDEFVEMQSRAMDEQINSPCPWWPQDNRLQFHKSAIRIWELKTASEQMEHMDRIDRVYKGFMGAAMMKVKCRFCGRLFDAIGYPTIMDNDVVDDCLMVNPYKPVIVNNGIWYDVYKLDPLSPTPIRVADIGKYDDYICAECICGTENSDEGVE